MFPERSLPSRTETRKFHGHYGNEIRMVDLSIRGAPARIFLEHLWKNLPSLDRTSILDHFDKHVDSSGGLHLRLDKEDVFRGILRVKERDPIKIHLSFRRSIKSDLEPNGEIKRLLESFETNGRNPTD